MEKRKIAVLFGGYSPEYEISLQSAYSVITHLDSTKYDPVLLGITKSGECIERYPKGKENITGIAYEPWHFRYVGAPHAMIMRNTGDTLEEYHARLKQFPYGYKTFKYDFGCSVIAISYLTADKENIAFEIEHNTVYTVSGNNMDGFIITAWRVNR